MFKMKSFSVIPARKFILIAAFLSPFIVFSAVFSQSTEHSHVSDRATLIVLAPVGPVFVDLHLTVSRIPYREWVARFLATDMDLDQSGRLDGTELSLLTDGTRTLAGVKDSAEILKAMNAVTDDVAVDVAALQP